MKSFWLILFLFSGFLVQENGSVEVFQVEQDDFVELKAKNTHPFPITIELGMEIENLKPDKSIPVIDAIPANQTKKMVVLRFTDKSKGWSVNTRYSYYMGSIFARHNDSFAYHLPFPKGETYKLDQGFGGAFSHQGDLQHALDFNMPSGTAVYAARGGTVVMMEQNNTRGGDSRDMMEYANFITILHDDGTFADYTHLKHRGVQVSLGQEVRIGQLIGYSGATGYATGPHLHFIVKKAKKGGGFVSIPVKFTTKDGIMELEEGQRYFGY
jgi:murein DD-endopeptidase MepM/ murein hydrolase activator NlpD